MLCRENHFISINPRSGCLAGCGDSRRSKLLMEEHFLRLKLLIKSKIQPKQNTRIMKTLYIIKFIVSHVLCTQIQLASFGASSWLARVQRSLPTTARPVELLQPSFWVLCPLKRGVQMWMKQIWPISGEPQLLRYKVCWLTRCQDVGLHNVQEHR